MPTKFVLIGEDVKFLLTKKISQDEHNTLLSIHQNDTRDMNPDNLYALHTK